jgi:hypothetical protein
MKIWLENHIIWYFRQLLPLPYRTVYVDVSGRRHLATWRMWFGRCYDITDCVDK